MKQYKVKINLNDGSNVSSGPFSVPNKTSDLTNDSGFVTTDTKNTAGSTDTSNKIFLVGATSQAANPQTYSHAEVYVNQYDVLVGTTGFSSFAQGSSSNGGLLTLAQNVMTFKAGTTAAKLTVTHNASYGSFDISDNGGYIYLQKTGSASTGSSPSSSYLQFPNVGTSSAPKTIATTDDIPSVLSTGASNKDKYLHTNASTGALEWSSIAASANYYAISNYTSSNGIKIATGYSSGTASTTYDLYVPNGSETQAGVLVLGGTATTAAKGNHTHSASITAVGSDGTTLSANTWYTLSAGGGTVIFKTPADTNYYPTRSYTSGLQISSYSGSTNCQLYVPYMTASQYGVAKVYAVRSSAITATTGGTTSSRYYGVEKDSNGKLFTNVPWAGVSNAEFVAVVPGDVTITFTEYSSGIRVSLTVYDGADDTGTALYTIGSGGSAGTQTVTVTSGSLYIKATGTRDIQITSSGSTGGVSGVTITAQYSRTVGLKADVSGDGTLAVSLDYDY